MIRGLNPGGFVLEVVVVPDVPPVPGSTVVVPASRTGADGYDTTAISELTIFIIGSSKTRVSVEAPVMVRSKVRTDRASVTSALTFCPLIINLLGSKLGLKPTGAAKFVDSEPAIPNWLMLVSPKAGGAPPGPGLIGVIGTAAP